MAAGDIGQESEDPYFPGYIRGDFSLSGSLAEPAIKTEVNK